MNLSRARANRWPPLPLGSSLPTSFWLDTVWIEFPENTRVFACSPVCPLATALVDPNSTAVGTRADSSKEPSFIGEDPDTDCDAAVSSRKDVGHAELPLGGCLAPMGMRGQCLGQLQ